MAVNGDNNSTYIIGLMRFKWDGISKILRTVSVVSTIY